MTLYLRLVEASIRAKLQYKWDFAISLVLYAVITAVDFMTVAVILYRYKTVAGWTTYEIALLSGVASTSYGLFRIFGAELDSFERYLVNGEFDTVLIRPWPTLATVLSRNFDIGRAGAMLQGLVLITIGLKEALAQGAPLWLVPYVFLLPVAGTCILMSLCLMTATAGFWLTRISDLMTFTLNAPNTAANYPMEIFPRWLRWLLTGILPVATMGYIPLNYALGKGGIALHLAVPFVSGALALAVSYRFWLWGERRYQSTGN